MSLAQHITASSITEFVPSEMPDSLFRAPNRQAFDSDPIFAAIDAHLAVSGACSQSNPGISEKTAESAAQKTGRVVAGTVPSTLAGLLAAIRFLRRFKQDGIFSGEDEEILIASIQAGLEDIQN